MALLGIFMMMGALLMGNLCGSQHVLPNGCGCFRYIQGCRISYLTRSKILKFDSGYGSITERPTGQSTPCSWLAMGQDLLVVSIKVCGHIKTCTYRRRGNETREKEGLK